VVGRGARPRKWCASAQKAAGVTERMRSASLYSGMHVWRPGLMAARSERPSRQTEARIQSCTMADAACERSAELLGDYVDDVLSTEDRAALSTHFLSCRRCRELLAAYRGIPEILRNATDVRFPGDLRARLRWLLRR